MSIKRIYFLDFLQYEFDFSIYVDYNSVKENISEYYSAAEDVSILQTVRLYEEK